MRKILNPDLYHGRGKKGNFFEGWYFKLVDSKEERAYSFIPGIFLGNNQNYSHAFIQLLYGKEVVYYYNKYDVKKFKWAEDKFLINIEENIFSIKGIKLNIKNEDIDIKGKVLFKNILKWPDTIINPGSMGFYNYLSFMQCYSQVCVTSMNLQGGININGEHIDFTGGKGYIEKNWGRDFPYGWIWVQCNNFVNSKVSISCSIGQVPFLSGSFDGFLIGLAVGNKFYKFTTINRSQLKIWRSNEDFVIETKNKNYSLYIIARSNKDKYFLCNAPREDAMIPLAKETLAGEVYLKLKCNKTGAILCEDKGVCAGIEYGGNVEELIKK
ncbi:tocopherol cyclase family protein [Clostridium sp. MSJ-11]|uniref:Tocopherol cyclase family protein n=1 Tax=Clostridium mobile TaxID=2841512 RepID=A0ABS6ELY3_9CLOT|nr:tocopherol cyclase family protein [Clostridium mobile]MBU5485409.1 tocopherol cyclase family protein [Clostridium mobile]